tara:strand:- start:125 stop:313 length:189 start_codon:yes stop_codon:yes gene_type:complete
LIAEKAEVFIYSFWGKSLSYRDQNYDKFKVKVKSLDEEVEEGELVLNEVSLEARKLGGETLA